MVQKVFGKSIHSEPENIYDEVLTKIDELHKTKKFTYGQDEE